MRLATPAPLALLLMATVVVGLAPAATAAPEQPPAASSVRSWLTTADARSLLAPVGGLSFGTDRPAAPTGWSSTRPSAARCSAGRVRR